MGWWRSTPRRTAQTAIASSSPTEGDQADDCETLFDQPLAKKLDSISLPAIADIIFNGDLLRNRPETLGEHMMKTKLSSLALAFCGAVFVSACGGGGGDSSTSTSTSTTSPTALTLVTGTAAAGSPIIGKVTVKDSTGTQRTVDIATDGSYSVDVAGMSAPFLFRAIGTVGGRTVAYVSAATGAGTVNITPFTDLIVANIVGMATETYFVTTNPSASTITAAELSARTQELATRIRPALDALGVAKTFDLLHTAFKADHSGFDAVMDVLKVEVDAVAAKATITNIVDNQKVIDDLTSKTDNTVLLAADSTLQTAVSDLAGIENLLKSLTSLYATRVPSSTALTNLIDPDALDYGLNRGEMVTSARMLDDNSIGIIISNPMIIKRSDGGKVMWVNYQYHMPATGESGTNLTSFRKSASGTWSLFGNRQLAETSIDSVNARYTENLQTSQYSYSRYLGFWTSENAPSVIQYVTFSGPGLPTGVQLPAVIGGSFDGIVLRRSRATAGSSFDVIGSAGTWLALCQDLETGSQAQPCVDETKLVANSEYTVKYYDANGNRLGETIPMILPAGPVTNTTAQANGSQWFAAFSTFSPEKVSQIVNGTNIRFNWILPSNTSYVPRDIDFYTSDYSFHQRLKKADTSRIIGLWSAPTPPAYASVGINVHGPLNRQFTTGWIYPQ